MFLAKIGLEGRLAHVLSGDQGIVALLRERSVFLQLRHGCNETHQLFVADRELALGGIEIEQTTLNQTVQHPLTEFRTVEQSRIPPTERRPKAVLLLAQRLLKFTQRNLAAADTGHGVAAATGIAHVRLHAPQGKWQGDQGKDALGKPLVVANDIEHARLS